MEKIQAVIFDLNGVFITSEPLSIRFQNSFNVSTENFLPALSKVMDEVRVPNAPDCYSLFKPHLQDWKLDSRFDRDAFYKYWFEAEKPDEEMVDFARKLKNNGVKVFALSNNFRERTDFYDKNFPFMKEIFTQVRYSWKTGFVKPDLMCWKSILSEYKLDASRVLYFDDSSKNVAAASSLGIRAYKFEGFNQVKNIVDKK